MKTARLWIVLAGAILVGSSLGATAARADGLPVLGVDVGATGVATPSGQARYVTIPAGADTVIARVDAQGGRIGASLFLPGTFTIPAVAYDGSASGLSGDGHTLILIEPRASFPRAETRLAVLRTRPLLWRTTITLPGDFSFDAVSPDGSSLYLIQYTSVLDPTKYSVRVYDLVSSRLVKAPIVDPHERGEKMRGQPLTRATSSDGRWAYTLYDGAGKAPFVHALDTSNRTARWPTSKLDTRRGLLIVTRGARPALNVDLANFQARPPSTGTSGFPWLPTTVLTFGVLVIAAVLPSRIRVGRSASGSGPSSPHRAA